MASNTCDDIDIDIEIDRILSEYEKTVKASRSLLLTSKFKLPNSRCVVECGLSPVRNFSPTILLRKQDVEMIFSTLEWSQLVNELRKLYNSFLTSIEIDNSDHSAIPIGDFTTIDKVSQANGKQLMLMQRLTSLYLSDSDINELLKIDSALVSYRITMLNNLNFSYYYHNVLHFLKQCFNYNSSSKFNNMTIVEILNVFCESTGNSLLSNTLREYIYFHKDDIM